MTEPVIRGGNNIAMKVPAHQFAVTVECYRRLGFPVTSESDATVVFDYGPVKLHVDSVDNLSQAEIWLEFIATDLAAAKTAVDQAGFVRCDEIEQLGDLNACWVTSPASIVHLVIESG